MSLAIAIQTKDGIAIASDSRGTFGDPRGVTGANDTIQKLYGLSKHTAIAVAGANEIGATLLDRLFPMIQEKQVDGIDQILDLTSNLFKTKYDEWFPNFPPPQRPGLVGIIAGLRLDGGKPVNPMLFIVMSQLNFAPSLSNYGFAVIGVPQYAIYLLNRLYSREMSISSATELAAYCISETATQDGKVGGPIQIGQITPARGFLSLSEKQVDEMLKGNLGRTKRLKKLFFGNKKTA